MTKLEKAVEIVRGMPDEELIRLDKSLATIAAIGDMTDEELKKYIRNDEWCPGAYGLHGSFGDCPHVISSSDKPVKCDCESCWDEEVSL